MSVCRLRTAFFRAPARVTDGKPTDNPCPVPDSGSNIHEITALAVAVESDK